MIRFLEMTTNDGSNDLDKGEQLGTVDGNALGKNPMKINETVLQKTRPRPTK